MSVYAFGFVRYVFFFKQKTAYEMRISDWSSDVCSSDLLRRVEQRAGQAGPRPAPDGPPRPVRAAHLQRRAGGQGQARAGPLPSCDRKSVVEGKGVSVRVVPGGRRTIKKKKTQ